MRRDGRATRRSRVQTGRAGYGSRRRCGASQRHGQRARVPSISVRVAFSHNFQISLVLTSRLSFQSDVNPTHTRTQSQTECAVLVLGTVILVSRPPTSIFMQVNP